RGWVLGSADLPGTLSESVRAAVERARETITGLRGTFSNAWQRLAGDALEAFDAVHGQLQTSAERALAALRGEREQQAIADAVADARRQLETAQGALAGLAPA